MPRNASHEGQTKFQRYREARQARGLRLVRIWVPDPAAPGFAAQAHEQAMSLRGAAEEAEVLDFIEALAASE